MGALQTNVEYLTDRIINNNNNNNGANYSTINTNDQNLVANSINNDFDINMEPQIQDNPSDQSEGTRASGGGEGETR